MRVSAEINTDERFRGRSVSQERPTANLDLSYDGPAGLYAGLAGAGVASAHDGPQFLSVREYAGFARRLSGGPTLDLGLTHAHYSEYYGGRDGTEYTEAYVGLIARRATARLYYSPSYFSGHDKSLYGEIETAIHPAPKWRVSAHAGVLTRLQGDSPAGVQPTQFDWRLGLTRAVRSFEVELAWSGAGPDKPPYARDQGRSGLALALRRDF